MPEFPLNLLVKNLVLRYPKKTVLNGLTARFASGKINILIGENGAGKSSLIKIICGDILPSFGEILINDKSIKIKNPGDAIKNGIVCVHQRPILADGISILENLSLGVKHFDKKKAEKELKNWLPEVSPKTLVKNCSGDERFFISLTGAILKNPALLILDEPSALLNLTQRDFLFSRLREFAKGGMNIIVITHFMDEAKGFGDTVTCLDEGNVKFSLKKGSKELEEKIKALKITSFSAENVSAKESKLVISLKNLTCIPRDKPAIKNFSFTANGGKITLVCGQAEDGRETLEDLITGMSEEKQSGEIQITEKGGRSFFVKIKTGRFTRRTLEKSPFTFGIIPSNKTFRASNPNLTIQQLLTTSEKPNDDKKNKNTLALIKKADVNIQPDDKVSFLSGGMLQRLILEREIEKNPDILILCEPVQGLDSERSQNVFKQITKIAQSGKIVIVLASADFPKELCEQIYTLEKTYDSL